MYVCPPIRIPNGRQIYFGLEMNGYWAPVSQVEFTCNAGYQLSGRRVISCRDNGTAIFWIDEIPMCIVGNKK